MTRVIKTESLNECITAIDYSSEGEYLCAGLIDDTSLVWVTKDLGKPKYKFDSNGLGVVDVKFNKSGSVLGVSSLDSNIYIYSMDEGTKTSEINCGPMGCWKIAFDKTGNKVITAGELGLVKFYDNETAELDDEKAKKTIDVFASSLACSPNGKYLAVGNTMGGIFVFDLDSKSPPEKIDAHGKTVRALEFSSDSGKLISASDDQHINIFDLKSKAIMLSLTGHSANINCLSAHPKNPKIFLSSSLDKTIRLWDLDKKDSVQTVGEGDDDFLWAAKFSHDGKQIASGGESGNLKIYSLV